MRGDIAAAICGKKASERQGALFDVLVFLLSDLADSFSLAIFLSPDLDKVMLKGKSRKNQKNRDARSEQNSAALAPGQPEQRKRPQGGNRFADVEPVLRSEDLATLQTQLGFFLTLCAAACYEKF
jgi:hypothetical protein